MDRKSENDFCFCTLALGKMHVDAAKELAKDIETYSPGTSFVVFTGNPAEFNNLANVKAFKHRQKSVVYPYHDKRCVIEKALSLFYTAIFIDADMRVLGSVLNSADFPPGILAKSCYSMAQFYKTLSEHHRPEKSRSYKIIKKLAKRLGVDFDKAKFVHEYLFAVTRNAGAEKVFLDLWERLAAYAELRWCFALEGSIIGLAALKANFSVQHTGKNFFKVESFFKDRIVQYMISDNLPVDKRKKDLYEKWRSIEEQNEGKRKKKWHRGRRYLSYLFRLLLLWARTLKDVGFYYT